MDTMRARRIESIGVERTAMAEGCSIRDAQRLYDEAMRIVQDADAYSAVRQLIAIAKERGTTADELIRCYA